MATFRFNARKKDIFRTDYAMENKFKQQSQRKLALLFCAFII